MYSNFSLLVEPRQKLEIQKQVRFNLQEEHVIATTNYSRTPSPRPSPSSLSSASTSTSEALLNRDIKQTIHVQFQNDSQDSQGTIFLPDMYDAHETSRAPLMSTTMLEVQEIPWNVHGSRSPTEKDNECATFFQGVNEIVLRSDVLLWDILVTPAPTQGFISIGRVYDAIRDALNTKISINSTLFEEQGTEMKRAIWENSRRRQYNNELGIKNVQWMDFLLDTHIVVGLSAQTGSKYWVLQFNEAELSYGSSGL